MTQQITRPQRPPAAIALGWLLIAQGALALAIFSLLLTALLADQPVPPGLEPTAQPAGQPAPYPAPAAPATATPGRGPILLSASAGLAGIFSLVSGVGLLRLQAWAWLLALITQGVVLLVALIEYWLGNPDYFSLALGVAQVYLLNRSDVQQAVRPAGPHSADAAPPALPAVALPPEESA